MRKFKEGEHDYLLNQYKQLLRDYEFNPSSYYEYFDGSYDSDNVFCHNRHDSFTVHLGHNEQVDHEYLCSESRAFSRGEEEVYLHTIFVPDKNIEMDLIGWRYIESKSKWESRNINAVGGFTVETLEVLFRKLKEEKLAKLQ